MQVIFEDYYFKFCETKSQSLNDLGKVNIALSAFGSPGNKRVPKHPHGH